MNKTSTVGQRIAGGVVGLLTGGMLLGGLSYSVFYTSPPGGDPDQDLVAFVILGGLGFLIGSPIGAAAGATMTQKSLRQRSSFWRALLGAVVGLLIGMPFVLTFFGTPLALVSIVAGAVLGSGWGAKPADTLAALPQQGVVSPGVMLKPQPGEAKCPFCRSIAFRVVHEAGCRRCSDCHSALPNYTQGNR